MPIDWKGAYHVRLLFTSLEGIATHPHPGVASTSSFVGISTKTAASEYKGQSTKENNQSSADFTVDVKARLLPPITRASTPSAASQCDTDNEDELHEGSVPPVVVEEAAVSILLCENVDLSEFQAKAGRALFEMRCQVSLNGQDFSSLKVHHPHKQRSQAHLDSLAEGSTHAAAAGAAAEHPPSTLVYAFTPESIVPACLSIDRLNPFQDGSEVAEAPHMDVVVKGSSFLPTSRLPKNAHVFARVVPVVAGIQWEAGFVSQLDTSEAVLDHLPSTVFPVRCESTGVLTVGMDVEGLAMLQEMVRALNALASGVDLSTAADTDGDAEALPVVVPQRMDLLPLQIVFDLHMGAQVIPLSFVGAGAQLVLNLYRNPPLQVVPNVCNAVVKVEQPYSLLVRRQVTADDAQVGLTSGTCADGFRFHSPQVQVAVHVPQAAMFEAAADDVVRADQFHAPILLPTTAVQFLPLSVAAPDVPASDEGAADSEAVDAQVSMPSAPLKYIVQVKLQALAHYVQLATGQTPTEGAPSFLYVSCWLDGVSVPPVETWAKLHFYHGLTHNSAVNPPAPKAGFVAGNSVNLDLLVPFPRACVLHPDVVAATAVAAAVDAAGTAMDTAGGEGTGFEETELLAPALQPVTQQQCVVRIRGAPSEELPHGAVLDVPASLAAAPTAGFQTTVTFDVPDLRVVHGMLPVQKTPKDKSMYFVDVSMDGGVTFDSTEVPLLFLK